MSTGGAIRHVGVSEVGVEQIERARQILPIAAVQNRYNLADRGHDDVIDHCTREGIAFVPYFPLRGDGGAATAERLGATENTVKLAWLIQRSPVGCPIRARSRSSTCARTSRRSSSSSRH